MSAAHLANHYVISIGSIVSLLLLKKIVKDYNNLENCGKEKKVVEVIQQNFFSPLEKSALIWENKKKKINFKKSLCSGLYKNVRAMTQRKQKN